MSPVLECGYCERKILVRKDTNLKWDRIRCPCGAEFNWLSQDGRWEILGIHDPPSDQVPRNEA